MIYIMKNQKVYRFLKKIQKKSQRQFMRLYIIKLRLKKKGVLD